MKLPSILLPEDQIEIEFEITYIEDSIKKEMSGTFTTFVSWDLADSRMERELKRKFGHMTEIKTKRKRTISNWAGGGYDTEYPEMNYLDII